MKKFKSCFYWIAVLVSYLLAFTLFGIIIAVVFGFPDSLIGGFASWSLIICFLLFGADDETREAVKAIIKKEHRPLGDPCEGDGARDGEEINPKIIS